MNSFYEHNKFCEVIKHRSTSPELSNYELQGKGKGSPFESEIAASFFDRCGRCPLPKRSEPQDDIISSGDEFGGICTVVSGGRLIPRRHGRQSSKQESRGEGETTVVFSLTQLNCGIELRKESDKPLSITVFPSRPWSPSCRTSCYNGHTSP